MPEYGGAGVGNYVWNADRIKRVIEIHVVEWMSRLYLKNMVMLCRFGRGEYAWRCVRVIETLSENGQGFIMFPKEKRHSLERKEVAEKHSKRNRFITYQESREIKENFNKGLKYVSGGELDSSEQA